MSDHSPTPWTIDGKFVFDAKGDSVFEIHDLEAATDMVRCVNAHDSLVAACKMVSAAIPRDLCDEAFLPALKACREAISKAEEAI